MRMLLSLVLVMNIFALCAQDDEFKRKTVLKELKEYVKAANYVKADEVLNGVVPKHTETVMDAELYNIWMDVSYNLALAENKKIYLGTNPDTVKYMDYIYNTYVHGLKCDSLDRLPNEKGRVKRKFQKNINDRLTYFASNLANAGKYFYKKKDYARTCKFVNMHLTAKLWRGGVSSFASICDSVASALLNSDDYRLSVLAVLSSYAEGNYEGAVNMWPVARLDTLRRDMVLEHICESYKSLGDMQSYLALLHEGFRSYSANEYFFASLIRYYGEAGEHDDALRIAREAVSMDVCNRNYWFVKGAEEQECGLPDSAICSYTQAIKIKSDDAESYARIAGIYLSKAHDEDQRFTQAFASQLSKKEYFGFKKKVEALYVKACRNYENAKKYGPDNMPLWFDGLKECYFKLNRGEDLRNLETVYK